MIVGSKNRVLGFMVLLTLLFLGRVSAQLIEYFTDISFIPNFDEWHSATLPYWQLLTFQILILAVMMRSCTRLAAGTAVYSRRSGMVLSTLGTVYLSSMILRHVLGLTIYSDIVWFTSFLSIYFHYVLASFVLTLGYLHRSRFRNGSMKSATCEIEPGSHVV